MQHHKKVPQGRLSQGLQPQKPPPQKNAPLSAAVESDVVGYTTVELTTKFTLVGINFSSLDGTDAIPVNEAIIGDFANGDQLQIQNGTGGYTTLVWREDAWYGLSSETPATVSLKRGTGIWVVVNNATHDTPVSVQLKGAVNLSDSLTTNFGQSYLIAATGLPVDAAVNGALFSWEGLADGDQLQIQNSSGGYTTLAWRTGDNKWYGLSSSVPATAVIPKESAIWLVSSNANAKVVVAPSNL